MEGAAVPSWERWRRLSASRGARPPRQHAQRVDSLQTTGRGTSAAPRRSHVKLLGWGRHPTSHLRKPRHRGSRDPRAQGVQGPTSPEHGISLAAPGLRASALGHPLPLQKPKTPDWYVFSPSHQTSKGQDPPACCGEAGEPAVWALLVPVQLTCRKGFASITSAVSPPQGTLLSALNVEKTRVTALLMMKSAGHNAAVKNSASPA